VRRANDMQYFLIAPFIVYAFYKWVLDAVEKFSRHCYFSVEIHDI